MARGDGSIELQPLLPPSAVHRAPERHGRAQTPLTAARPALPAQTRPPRRVLDPDVDGFSWYDPRHLHVGRHGWAIAAATTTAACLHGAVQASAQGNLSSHVANSVGVAIAVAALFTHGATNYGVQGRRDRQA